MRSVSDYRKNIVSGKEPECGATGGYLDKLSSREIFASPGGGSWGSYSLGNVKVHSTSDFSGNGDIVQTKLKINQPGDKYEQEADVMADRVVRMSSASMQLSQSEPAPVSIQRKCKDCQDEEENIVMRKPDTSGPIDASPELSTKISNTRGGGAVLPDATRSVMENGFGVDFSDVRIHTGEKAASMTQRISARAFTTGKDIYFNRGEFKPETTEGRRLLAHELTHVVQQRRFKLSTGIQRQESSHDWQYEASRLTTRELEAEVLEMREVLTTSSDEQTEIKYTFFERELQDRLSGRTEFRRFTSTMREVSDDTHLDIPTTSASAFIIGLCSGIVTEIPPAEYREFVNDMSVPDNQLEFMGGYYLGLPVGLWRGLTGLIEGIASLIEIGSRLTPQGMFRTAIGELGTFLQDREGYIQLRRRQIRQLRAIVRTLEQFGTRLQNEPGTLIPFSGDIGLALGEHLGESFTNNFFRQSVLNQGRYIGNLAGIILFEVLLELILLVATEGIGNVLRGIAAVGQSARVGGRLSTLLKNALRAIPEIRDLIRILSVAEDSADSARIGGRTTDLSPDVDQSPSLASSADGNGLPPPVPEGTTASSRGHRGATAEGIGNDFSYEFIPETERQPTVTRRVGSSRGSQSQVDEIGDIPEATRQSTSQDDIIEVIDESSEGTSFSRSISDPSEINTPDIYEAERISSDTSGARLQTREVWEPPSGASPPPPLTASLDVRRQWLRQRLELHVDQAIERFHVEGLTPRQAADSARYAAHRGSRIDQFAKDSIMQDPDLAPLITAPDFVSEPDILDSIIPDWFDVTTRASWRDHLIRYQERYGSAGHLLDTHR